MTFRLQFPLPAFNVKKSCSFWQPQIKNKNQLYTILNLQNKANFPKRTAVKRTNVRQVGPTSWEECPALPLQPTLIHSNVQGYSTKFPLENPKKMV